MTATPELVLAESIRNWRLTVTDEGVEDELVVRVKVEKCHDFVTPTDRMVCGFCCKCMCCVGVDIAHAVIDGRIGYAGRLARCLQSPTLQHVPIDTHTAHEW